MSQLPEFTNPPDLFYNASESEKYHRNTRIIKIQSEITERALDLLEIPKKEMPFIVDLGCGSGLSGRIMTNKGYNWIGLDASIAMLDIAVASTESLGYLKVDIGAGLPFQDDSFDYAISISAVQWLFHSFESAHIPIQRIRTFLRSLYRCVRKKAVLQFYCNKKEIEILKNESNRAGFFGAFVCENENTKNSKNYLILCKNKPIRENKKIIENCKDKRKRAKVE